MGESRALAGLLLLPAGRRTGVMVDCRVAELPGTECQVAELPSAEVQKAGCRYRVPSAECRVPAECQVPAGCRVPTPNAECRSVECRVPMPSADDDGEC